MRRSRRCTALFAGIAVLFFIPYAARAQTDAVTLFHEACESCHTVGGGEAAGPDLIASTKWPHDELRAAVERMQENTGPLTAEQIDALVALLQKPDVKEILAAPPAAATSTPEAPPLPKGNASTGERLFFGTTPLANGGSPCFACHAVNGRGGNLSRDLTLVASRLGESPLITITEHPGFPLMRAAYLNRPVTAEEARDVVAFLQQSARAGTATPTNPIAVHATAGGLAILALAAVGLAARARRAGARARMIRIARRRTP